MLNICHNSYEPDVIILRIRDRVCKLILSTKFAAEIVCILNSDAVFRISPSKKIIQNSFHNIIYNMYTRLGGKKKKD